MTISATGYSGKWLVMMNITVPVRVTRKLQVKAHSTKGCISINTPSPIRQLASSSQGPRRRRRRPDRKPFMRAAPCAISLRKIPIQSACPIFRRRIADCTVRLSGSFAHRPEGDPAQQVFAQQDGKDHHRQQEQRGPGGYGGPVLAANPKDRGDERRGRLRRARGQQEGKGIFVPGKDQAKDRR